MGQRTGILQGLDIKGGAREKQAVELLSNYFYVTFSRVDNFKYSNYTFAFLKPQDKYRDMFNLYNEVLLLFLPYPKFDTRFLDFVDKTLSLDYPNRLDKICVIIVSADSELEYKIDILNRHNKESKIIVPFTYEELLDKSISSEKLENKFAKYFYSRDLFALESPLKSENYFYGRSQIVQELYDKYRLGEHAGLFGLRKIGKTSVLYGLERMINLRQGCSIYIDCQDTAIHKSHWNELLYLIIQKLKEKYGLCTITRDISDYNEKLASQSFESDLKTIQNALDGRPMILLVFDEIEHITFNTSTSDNWREGNDYLYFWQTIRANYQKNDFLFSFVIAGVNPMCIEKTKVGVHDNPIFSLIKPIYLELFNLKNVTEMVESIGKYMGLVFDPEIFTHLTDDYGGHPFLIRHVCSLINNDTSRYRPQTVTKFMYKEKKTEYDTLMNHYVELIINILQTCYPDEYNLLETLVDQGSEKFVEAVGFQKNLIQHLIGYGIVKEENKKYYITINAVEKYIESVIKENQRPETKTGKWAFISTRRNSFEERLRKLVYTIIRINYGKKTKEQILSILEEHRRNQISSSTLEEIVNEHLYFSDLVKLIVKHWSFFEKVFNDKMKFESYMTFVNKHRVDAHAKDISEEDLGLLTISLKWLEESIEDIS